jgi:hypothetical protein
MVCYWGARSTGISAVAVQRFNLIPGELAMTLRSRLVACLSLTLLLALVAGPAAAAVTIFVENIHGHVPDTDGIFEGDPDPMVFVWVDGSLVTTTPVINGTTNPNWSSFSCSLPITPGGGNTPLVSVILQVVDDEGVPNPQQYIGAVSFMYDWQAGLPVTVTGPIVGPYSFPGDQLTATIRVVSDAVPSEAAAWGDIKASYR